MNFRIFFPGLSLIFALFFFQNAVAASDTSQTLNAIEQRIKPVGQVQIEQPKAETVSANASTSLTGQEIYDKYCVACHATGAAGSPKLGDKEAWKTRVAQGKETLYKHALQGFKLMPPKGACMTCSDNDIKSAVDYLVKESGN